jgi:YD repeat-containing protein
MTGASNANDETTRFSYDASGNMTQVAKPDGVANRFVHDRVNRLTGVDLKNDNTLDI